MLPHLSIVDLWLFFSHVSFTCFTPIFLLTYLHISIRLPRLALIFFIHFYVLPQLIGNLDLEPLCQLLRVLHLPRQGFDSRISQGSLVVCSTRNLLQSTAGIKGNYDFLLLDLLLLDLLKRI